MIVDIYRADLMLWRVPSHGGRPDYFIPPAFRESQPRETTEHHEPKLSYRFLIHSFEPIPERHIPLESGSFWEVTGGLKIFSRVQTPPLWKLEEHYVDDGFLPWGERGRFTLKMLRGPNTSEMHVDTLLVALRNGDTRFATCTTDQPKPLADKVLERMTTAELVDSGILFSDKSPSTRELESVETIVPIYETIEKMLQDGQIKRVRTVLSFDPIPETIQTLESCNLTWITLQALEPQYHVVPEPSFKRHGDFLVSTTLRPQGWKITPSLARDFATRKLHGFRFKPNDQAEQKKPLRLPEEETRPRKYVPRSTQTGQLCFGF